MTSAQPLPSPTHGLAAIVERTRRVYAAHVAGTCAAPSWWTAVAITSSSRRQAERYEWELQRRAQNGRIPAGTRYLVVPDLADQRIGSATATLTVLRALVPASFQTHDPLADLTQWWSSQRVLLIHAGGDSRRLPQYSLSGKLFSAVPVTTPWGDPSTVFDEMLAFSTAWAERLPSGLVVGSGDVVLTFDPDSLHWQRPGVTGVAMLQPAEIGARHGVYVTDGQGRTYSFFQKPTISELKAAGGLLEGDRVALDTGLLRFSAEAAARLTQLAGADELAGPVSDTARPDAPPPPAIDLYRHVTMALTGQWKPEQADHPLLHSLFDTVKDLPFWCSVVSGDFTHIGTTALFRNLMTRDTEFFRLYAAQQRLGVMRQQGVRSAGVVIDSVLSGGADLETDTVVIECNLTNRVRAASGAVLHGLEGISEPVDVPENTVVHHVPVRTPAGFCGVVIRVYGVEDDPKESVDRGNATWFGRPILEELRYLGIDPNDVWPDSPAGDRTLWNARLFPVTDAEDAWACARWLQHLSAAYSSERWKKLDRLSLATSTQFADEPALQAARSRRLNANWKILATELVESGADIRPLLANAPGTKTLAETATVLRSRAVELAESAPTEAAGRHYAASLFFGQAGLAEEAGESRASAFRLVERAVELGCSRDAPPAAGPWRFDEVTVEAPARIDLGGGWSDTPPFCLDWGGTVLNAAVLLDGACPIRTTIRRLHKPVVRCVSAGDGGSVEYRTCEELLQPPCPGDPFSIHRTALHMTGLFHQKDGLADVLQHMGSGIEIATSVNLPIGSGLGTSSILAATTLRALDEMMEVSTEDLVLTERVMRLEQLMTTGGGWQDQVGGIFAGAKLVVTGPGLQQRVRIQPVRWAAGREAEFQSRLVLHYTGLRRIARDLLRQVVGRYLARETACVQVLHSIKTLATEMAFAMQEGDWSRLGGLLDRHWELNQVLDPNTTNAPINRLLEAVRPFVYGAKLAGAGGGGFQILLARDPKAAQHLRELLAADSATTGGRIYDCTIAREGLRAVRR